MSKKESKGDLNFMNSTLEDFLSVINEKNTKLEKNKVLVDIYKFNVFTCDTKVIPLKNLKTLKLERNIDYDQFKAKVYGFFSFINVGREKDVDFNVDFNTVTINEVIDILIPMYDNVYHKFRLEKYDINCDKYYSQFFEKLSNNMDLENIESIESYHELEPYTEHELNLIFGIFSPTGIFSDFRRMRKYWGSDDNPVDENFFNVSLGNLIEEVFDNSTKKEIETKIKELNDSLPELEKIDRNKNRKVLTDSIKLIKKNKYESYFTIAYTVLKNIFKTMGISVQTIIFGYYLVRLLKNLYLNQNNVENIEKEIEKYKLVKFLFPENITKKYKNAFYNELFNILNN